MSSKKRGGGADDIYSEHLFGAGNKYRPSVSGQREYIIERNIERNLTEICINRFEWINLPDSIDPRFLELCLFYNGLSVVYFDTDYDKLLAVRGTGTGYVNMLDNPVAFTVLGPGSIVKPLTDTAPAQFQNKQLSALQITMLNSDNYTPEELKMKAIPIWPNALRYPDIDTVKLYAKRLAIIDRSIEINSKNARRNKLITATQDTQLSMINANRQLDEGVEAIQVTGPAQDLEAIKAIDLGILPEQYEKLHLLRTRWWNECMSLLGIDSSNQDKKERLVEAEVHANDEQTESVKQANLKARKFAANLINKVHGTNIDVMYSTKFVERQEADEDMKLEKELNDSNDGGENNGDIHDSVEGRD